ncbi:MAG: GHKL domain-containing protein [Firmicutes bacterium]|nr:GHKL domain-containing protein [Bacillota bacterium]
MNYLILIELLNYGLVSIFGIFLTTFIAGGWNNARQRRWIILACPISLLIQVVLWQLWGTATVEKLYPLIVHVPLFLILVFPLKKRVLVALTSILSSYLCCEIPRWLCLSATALSKSLLVGEICYTLSIIPIFILLYRYFAPSAYDAITGSRKSLFLFGSLPLGYYLFDYITTVYSNALYSGIHALNEFLPTILIVFYVFMLTAYQGQQQKQSETKLRQSMLEAELKQSETEMENLRRAEKQTAIYRHDMRHHLQMIGHFLAANKIDQAENYIRQVQADVEAITPKRFCENEIVNLLCSSFAERIEKEGIRLHINVTLPNELPVFDTEICSILSNGLENALHATKKAKHSQKTIEVYSAVKHNRLLIEIKNPFSGEIKFKDGIPQSVQKGHGYGCRSIHTIVKQYRGICSFTTENDIFILQIILPLI